MWETRALELNNQDIWNWPSVCRLLNNKACILPRND